MPMTDARVRQTLIGLVLAASIINYIDRQMIALLKPLLVAEFGWSNDDYSNMTIAFQFAAAIGFLFAGWFVDRVGVRRGYSWGVGVWSLAAAAHALANTVAGFLAIRMALGFAESVGTPAAVKSAAVYVPAKWRSTALGLINTAPNIGAIVTPLMIPPLALAFGWRTAFIVGGALGAVWLVAWLALKPARAVDADDELATTKPIAWGSLLRDRRVQGFALAKVLTDQVWWFMLFWAPDFFERQFGLDLRSVGLPLVIVYGLAACGALSGGYLGTRLLARGWALDRARKVPLLVYALIVVPVPLVLTTDSPWVAAVMLGMMLFAHQGFSTNLFAVATDAFPSRTVASVIGIGAFCGNIWVIGLLKATGLILDAGGGYLPMFAVASVSYLLAYFVVRLFIPRLEPRTETLTNPVPAH